jgi:hypothetical protein
VSTFWFYNKHCQEVLLFEEIYFLQQYQFLINYNKTFETKTILNKPGFEGCFESFLLLFDLIRLTNFAEDNFVIRWNRCLEALIPDLKKTWKQRQNGSRIQDLK